MRPTRRLAPLVQCRHQYRSDSIPAHHIACQRIHRHSIAVVLNGHRLTAHLTGCLSATRNCSMISMTKLSTTTPRNNQKTPQSSVRLRLISLLDLPRCQFLLPRHQRLFTTCTQSRGYASPQNARQIRNQDVPADRWASWRQFPRSAGHDSLRLCLDATRTTTRLRAQRTIFQCRGTTTHSLSLAIDDRGRGSRP